MPMAEIGMLRYPVRWVGGWRTVTRNNAKQSKALFVFTSGTYDRQSLMDGRVGACSLIENGEEISVVASGMQARMGIKRAWLSTFTRW